MGKIADLFKDHAEAYLQKYGSSLPATHRKVIEAITSCRTSKAGVNVYYCQDCEEQKVLYRGCGNRHCPNCQEVKAQQWLHKKLSQQLPGPHFFITFTVPEALRPFMRSNQKICYEALFKASSDALKTMAANPTFVGGDLAGFMGVLHTWGRTLSYHPHIHYIIPGGAIDRKTGHWKRSHHKFFGPVHALSKMMRNNYHALMKEAGLLSQIPPEVWDASWNVNSQATGTSAEGALKYLAPYVFRVAISDSRIVSVVEDRVTFRYRDHRTNQDKTMLLQVLEFMRRFLQHVLPTGFHKIRSYGFLGSGSRIKHEERATMIELAHSFECVRPKPPKRVEPKQLCCSKCGKAMHFELTYLPHEFTFGKQPMLR